LKPSFKSAQAKTKAPRRLFLQALHLFMQHAVTLQKLMDIVYASNDLFISWKWHSLPWEFTCIYLFILIYSFHH